MKNKFIFITLLMVLPVYGIAATLIENTDDDGIASRIFIDGNKARFEMPDNEGYVVINTDSKTMQLVMSQQRIVVNMSPSLKGQGSVPNKSTSLQLKSKGKGPEILGYTTNEYDEYVGDQYCGTVFSSTQASNDTGIARFVSSFSIMMSEMNAMYSDMAEEYTDVCDKANVEIGDTIHQIGLPLKSLDMDRRVTNVITKLDKNAVLPANAFVIPAAYKVINAEQFAQEIMKQVPEELKGMMERIPPEALEAMQQQMMQNMTPEMLEMMKKQMQ